MKKKQEDNVVFVLQKAIKEFNIKVTNTTIKEYLLSHPHYSSLKSVCDSLKKWGVEHYPLSLEANEIKELELPFIAHLKVSGGQLIYVKKILDNKITYQLSENYEKIEDFEKFSDKLSGAVIVMDATKEAGEKKYKQYRQKEILNKNLLPLGIVTLLILLLSNFISNNPLFHYKYSYLYWGLLSTKLSGLTASIFLILHELKVHSSFADKICGFSSKTDCDTVLSSNASNIFGWINWADAGFIYFIGTLLYLTTIKDINSFWLLSVLSVLSVPYPVFSIYYQSVKLKKWCPFCLLVQLMLIAECVLLFPALKSISINVTDVLILAVSFLLPATIWFYYKVYMEKLTEKDKEHYTFLSFKRNPEIFKFLLQKGGFVPIPVRKDALVLGNPNAPVTLTAFLSLNCNPCTSAFKNISLLLSNCPDIKINAIFSVYKDDESIKLINTLYYIFEQKGSNEAIDFLDKWYSSPKSSRKQLYQNITPIDFNAAEQVGIANKVLFEKYKIEGTPTIYLNGYKFPKQYEYGDIENYIDEIISLTMESKRQEACANCH